MTGEWGCQLGLSAVVGTEARRLVLVLGLQAGVGTRAAGWGWDSSCQLGFGCWLGLPAGVGTGQGMPTGAAASGWGYQPGLPARAAGCRLGLPARAGSQIPRARSLISGLGLDNWGLGLG